MRSSLSLTLAATLAASLLAASTASAATEIGDTCAGDQEYSSAVTFFEASAPANPLPLAAPSAGVLTKWKVNLIPGVPFTFPQTLKVLRLNTASHTALVVGETTASAIASGLNTIDARIPVQAGDRPSIFGSGFIKTLICTTSGENNLIGGFTGNGGGVGSSNPYIELPEEFRVPVAAVIEPDADADGYGDETQDKCPQSAAVQSECPVVVLDSFAVPGKGKVVVLVGTSNEASVTVSGSAKLPKTAKASASAAAKLKKVTRKVTPGKIGRFTLKFPASLKEALRDLPKGKKLKLKITASTKNVTGQVSKDKTKLNLKGAS